MKHFSEGSTSLLIAVAIALAVVVTCVYLAGALYQDPPIKLPGPATYATSLELTICQKDNRPSVARFVKRGKDQVLMLSCGEKKITDKPHGD